LLDLLTITAIFVSIKTGRIGFMNKYTKDSFKGQNMVVACLDGYDDYRKRTIMFYCFLFASMAFSYGILFFVLKLFFAASNAFVIAHLVSVLFIDASLIWWVVVNLYWPAPLPPDRGVTPKIITIMFVYIAILFLMFFLLFRFSNVDWVLCVSIVSILGGFLYGLTAGFANYCEEVQKGLYYDSEPVNREDYLSLNNMVFNPMYRFFSINVWHKKDDD
jgi:hypothetical protein